MLHRSSLFMLTLGINLLLAQKNVPDSTQADSTRKVISIVQIARPDIQQFFQKVIADSQFIIIYWDSSRNEVFIHQMQVNDNPKPVLRKTDTLNRANLPGNQSTTTSKERDAWKEIIEKIFEGRVNKLRAMQGEQEEMLLRDLSGEEISYLLSLEGARNQREILENLVPNQEIQIIKIEASQPIFIIRRETPAQR